MPPSTQILPLSLIYIDRFSMHPPTRARFLIPFLALPPRRWSRHRTRTAITSAHATQQHRNPNARAAARAHRNAANHAIASTVHVAARAARQGHHPYPPGAHSLLDFGGTAWTILVLLIVLALRWAAALRNWAGRITPNKRRQSLLFLPPAIYLS
jgi:hypothetical protein